MSASTWLIIAIVGFSLSGVALVGAVILFVRLNIPAIIGDLTGRTVAREIKAMRDMNASSGDKRFRHSAVNLERGTLTEKVSDLSVGDIARAHASKRLDKTSGEHIEKNDARRTDTVGLSDAVVSRSERIGAEPTDYLGAEATEVLNTDSTEVLSENATEILHDNATEVLRSPAMAKRDGNATEVLSDPTTTKMDRNPTDRLDRNATEKLRSNVTELLSEGTEVLSEGTTVLSPTERLQDAVLKPVPLKITHDEVVTHSDEVVE